MIRKLYLVNSENETYDLQQIKSAFLNNINGLGFRNTIRAVNVEGTNFISDKEVSYSNITGSFNFENYGKYDEFIQFVERHDINEPFILKYQPDIEEWFVFVEIAEIRKPEISRNGYLETQLSLFRRSRFFQETEVIIDIDIGEITTGKKYTYTYGYTYFDDNSADVEINIDSQQDVGVLFTISGETLNPTIKQFLNGVLEAEVDITESTLGAEKIEIDSNLLTQKIVKITESGTEVSLYDPAKVDFSKQIFIRLKKGTNKIVFSNELSSGSLRIVYRLERVSV